KKVKKVFRRKKMSMSKDSNESPLSFEISRFYADRDRLNKLLDQSESLLDKDFVKVLSPELVAEIRENLALQGVRERVNQLFKSGGGFNSSSAANSLERPCIVVVGQSNSGKSTFINELLGRKFVDQSSTPCTARVTRITYADRVTVRLLDKHGKQLGQTVQPEDGKIDENLIWLKDDSREDANLLSASVELGVPSEFLRKCGLDIVDSPGLNENDALDTLTMRAIDSFLPIILYVIDGRYGITLAAEKDIENIRATAPELELFYLVTKMDVSKEDIPTPESGRTIEDIEQDRARRVFSRLKKLQCFGAEETPESCSRFFCISSWEMKNYRRRVAIAIKRSGGDQAAGAAVKRSKWVLRFNEMQQKLADFAAEQFRSLILGACSGLRVLHCQTMDLVMNKANDIRACTQMRRKNLEMIRAMECRNHEQSKKIVEKHREGFEREAESLIKSQGPILLEEVKSMEYSENVIDANLSSNQIEERCVTEIHRFINNRVIVAYQEFLQKGAMQDCFAELEDLKARVFEYERDIEQTPSLAVLKATLADECDLQASDIYSLGFRTVMRQMSLNIRTILRHPGVIFSRPVQDPEWKRFQAKCHIKKINTGRLVECLVDSMNKWLDKRHFRFLQKIRCSEQLVENSASLSELERQRIVQLAPRLAFMYTRCLNVATGYQFRGYTIDKRAQLGSGAQGTVYAVRDTQGEVAMAAKVVNVESQSLGNISSEVFYSSVLRHCNLLSIEGVRLLETREPDDPEEDAIWTFELYMDLMHSDVWQLMQNRQLTLRKRIWFGLQLARALEFLHSSSLIHRDVKLQNLLVDAELTTVRLTDFGLLKSTGLTGQSLVGTPIYLAPEMVTNSSYDISADVYSLGIALWYLCEGSGSKHPKYVEVMPSVGAILLAGSMNSRPDRLPCIPADLWDLMERCWDAQPRNRPPAKEVADALDYIEKNL
ncbi:hypothetical protein BOX15_Mlig016260g1, partial [Macrostomum lignano]